MSTVIAEEKTQTLERELNEKMVRMGLGRYLPHIITELLKAVPNISCDHESLRSSLIALRESARHAAPEAMGYWWNGAAQCLTREVGVPIEDWQKRVADIYSGKESAVKQ
jgi:hypothetical protein